jgi:hypothetical protein
MPLLLPAALSCTPIAAAAPCRALSHHCAAPRNAQG